MSFVFNPPTGLNDETVFQDEDALIRSHMQALLQQIPTYYDEQLLKVVLKSYVDSQDATKEPTIASKLSAFNKAFESVLANIKMNGTPSLGALNTIARGDHIHPSDTTKADKTTDFVKSQSANGYQKFPNGLIIQWGNVSVTTTGMAWTFPIAFPSAVYSVQATVNENLPTAIIAGVSPVATNVQFIANMLVKALVFAIGY